MLHAFEAERRQQQRRSPLTIWRPCLPGVLDHRSQRRSASRFFHSGSPAGTRRRTARGDGVRGAFLAAPRVRVGVTDDECVIFSECRGSVALETHASLFADARSNRNNGCVSKMTEFSGSITSMASTLWARTVLSRRAPIAASAAASRRAGYSDGTTRRTLEPAAISTALAEQRVPVADPDASDRGCRIVGPGMRNRLKIQIAPRTHTLAMPKPP